MTNIEKHSSLSNFQFPLFTWSRDKPRVPGVPRQKSFIAAIFTSSIGQLTEVSLPLFKNSVVIHAMAASSPVREDLTGEMGLAKNASSRENRVCVLYTTRVLEPGIEPACNANF